MCRVRALTTISPPKRVTGTIAKLDKYRYEEQDPAEEDGIAPLPKEEETATWDNARVLKVISLF